MKDLYRCLSEYPAEHLQALAVIWQTSPLAGNEIDKAHTLGDAMGVPETVASVLATCSEQAQDLLREVIADGGLVPAHRYTVRHGSIRRLGPARMVREEPWDQPESASEELFYKGFLYRSFGTVGDFYGQLLFVPQPLLDHLSSQLDEQPRFDFHDVDAPASIWDDGKALIEDMFAVLVQLRRGSILSPTRVEGEAQARSWLGLLDLGERLCGEASADRLRLILRLLVDLALVVERGGRLVPTRQAREWLRLSDRERLERTHHAWLSSERRSEFAAVFPEQDMATLARVSMPATRGALESVLSELATNRWISLESLYTVLHRHRPDLLHVDGDFSSWRVRDPKTGEYLSGPGTWEQVEVPLARYILTGPLRWLGLVAVGYREADNEPQSLALRPSGCVLLSPSVPAEAPPLPTLATVSSDLVVTMPTAGTLYDRYLLERFAEWQHQDQEAIYHITAESVWHSHGAGVRVEQILRFLERVSGGHVPEHVSRTLLAWGGRLGRASLSGWLLLETADEPTMSELVARSDVRRFLGAKVSPTSYLVDKDKKEALLERLMSLGIWPDLDD